MQDILARAVDQWQCVNSLEGEEKLAKVPFSDLENHLNVQFLQLIVQFLRK